MTVRNSLEKALLAIQLQREGLARSLNLTMGKQRVENRKKILRKINLITEKNQKVCHPNCVAEKEIHLGEDPVDGKMKGAETGFHEVEVCRRVEEMVFQEEVDMDQGQGQEEKVDLMFQFPRC